jgi:adenosine deaminase
MTVSDRLRGLAERAPKALLHDHLDGGLRPETVVELAAEYGYRHLPSTDVHDLAKWFHRGAKRNDLVLYLETFAHTCGVMQHADALERVAHECAADLAADGVVYAEIRFAPELHTESGLSLDDVVDAVLRGFRSGAAGTGLTIYAICCAMRTAARSLEIAELAVRHRDAGVVGFDIAGAEAGFPPTRHLDAFQYVQRENFHATIHAGEAFGLPSIGAVPNASVMECGSSTTSKVARAANGSEGWPPTSATAASRWSCARHRTSTRAWHPPSRPTPSGCCAGSGSGSRSTPTIA